MYIITQTRLCKQIINPLSCFQCVSLFSFPSSVQLLYQHCIYKICIQHLLMYNSNSLFYYTVAIIPLCVHNKESKKKNRKRSQLTETPILPFNLSIQTIMENKTRRSLMSVIRILKFNGRQKLYCS